MKTKKPICDYTSQAKTEQLESPAAREPKPQGYYDDRYIDEITTKPTISRTQALINAGYVGKYANQEAARIHKKLQSRIDEVVKDKKRNLAVLSIAQLEIALQTDRKELGAANMNQCIKMGLDYSGHKPSDTIIIEDKQLSYEEMLAELQEIERQEAEEAVH